jgi:hypothetical protein
VFCSYFLSFSSLCSFAYSNTFIFFQALISFFSLIQFTGKTSEFLFLNWLIEFFISGISNMILFPENFYFCCIHLSCSSLSSLFHLALWLFLEFIS